MRIGSVVWLLAAAFGVCGCVTTAIPLKQSLDGAEPPGHPLADGAAAPVIVAVIDTGIDWTHPDLRRLIWVNPGEDLNGNGQADPSDLNDVDDDDNGYVDDLIGWDFTTDGNDPMDTHGHGTLVSGVIPHMLDGHFKKTQPLPSIRIMAVRTRQNLKVDYHLVSKGIRYAVENGAKVVNLSFGTTIKPGVSLKGILSQADANGVLVVGAAGNHHTSRDHYPDGYEEVMSVAATNRNGVRQSYSNFGRKVEVAAKVPILTTKRGGEYGYAGGTSISAPAVAALGAMLFLKCPHLSKEQIRNRIKKTADSIDDMNPGFEGQLGAGLIHPYRALASCGG
jgi:serine protease